MTRSSKNQERSELRENEFLQESGRSKMSPTNLTSWREKNSNLNKSMLTRKSTGLALRKLSWKRWTFRKELKQKLKEIEQAGNHEQLEWTPALTTFQTMTSTTFIPLSTTLVLTPASTNVCSLVLRLSTKNARCDESELEVLLRARMVDLGDQLMRWRTL